MLSWIWPFTGSCRAAGGACGALGNWAKDSLKTPTRLGFYIQPPSCIPSFSGRRFHQDWICKNCIRKPDWKESFFGEVFLLLNVEEVSLRRYGHLSRKVVEKSDDNGWARTPCPLGWTKSYFGFIGKQKIPNSKDKLSFAFFHLAIYTSPNILVYSYHMSASTTPCLGLETFCLIDRLTDCLSRSGSFRWG